MYSVWVWLLILAVFVWILILTFLIWQQNNFLKSLFPKAGNRDIRKKFEEVLKAIDDFKNKQENFDKNIEELKEIGSLHISKVELLRYNPYEETGGDQSFTIALLNDKGSGFILTSLHARSGTRVFSKPIEEWKSSKYQLSKEEQTVIKKVMER